MAEYRIYSCDDHLDINAMPHHAWVSRLPSKYREAGPKVVERDGKNWWICEDRVCGISGRFEGFDTALDRVKGLDPDGLRAGDAKARLEDMDRDDLYASVIYGPNTLSGYRIEDPAHKKAVICAWNDWAAEEFNAVEPDRLSALPMLPTTSVDEAVSELHRVVGKGHRGAILHCFEIDLLDRGWDRLWAACVEVGVPLSFHIGGGSRLDATLVEQRAMFASIAPMQLDEPLSMMIYSGAFERYPELKIVLAESGLGWLPYLVARFDATFKKHCLPYPGKAISTLPSELFARNVYATFEEEPLGPELIPLLPPGNLMWACDYPHPDSTWPNSRAAIDHALGGLGDDAVRMITSDNCRQLYGFS